VKTPTSAASRSKVPATITVEGASDDKPGTSPTDATEPTSAKVEPPTAAPTQTSKSQVTKNNTKVTEKLAIKPDKRKISLSWLGKKEKPTTISDEKAETPKSPSAKLRATVGNPADPHGGHGKCYEQGRISSHQRCCKIYDGVFVESGSYV
jgi:hypothetical protein